MTSSRDWEIPRKVWAVLVSWGVGVLLIAGLLSFWIDRSSRQLQLEQDRAMCAMVELFLTGPEPVPGPEGERSRVIRAAMANYRAALHCNEIRPDPGPVRPR